MAENAVLEGLADNLDELYVKLEEREDYPGWSVYVYGPDHFQWQQMFFDPVEQNANFIREAVRSALPWRIAALPWCDVCLKYALSGMSAPEGWDAAVLRPSTNEVCYRCLCGRFVGPTIGYFDSPEGQRVVNAKVWQRCNSDNHAMFICKAGYEEVTFRCPHCGQRAVRPRRETGLPEWPRV